MFKVNLRSLVIIIKIIINMMIRYDCFEYDDYAYADDYDEDDGEDHRDDDNAAMNNDMWNLSSAYCHYYTLYIH